MKKVLFFISWFCCCFSIQAQHVREMPESEYGQFRFTYEQVQKLALEKGYPSKGANIKIVAHFDSTDCQYYWNYSIDTDYPYVVFLRISAFTGDLYSEYWRYKYPPHRHIGSDCKVYDNPYLPIMKRRLLANFETVDWKEYKKYKEGEDYSVKTLPGGLEGIWEKGDTAFRYYEFSTNQEFATILLYKEFYANGNIKEKGIRTNTQNCPSEIGLWYYFDPEGNLTIKDHDDLFSKKREDIVNLSKSYGYREGIEDNSRVQNLGLPDIQIFKYYDYSYREAKWNVVFYCFDPDLVKIEFELDEIATPDPSVTYYYRVKIDLEKELQRLKNKKEKIELK